MQEYEKKEPTLALNDFNKLEISEGRKTTVTLIMNILFGDEYMYPSIPDSVCMNIRKYKFRVLNENTLEEIQTTLKEKIDKFIPNNTVRNVIIRKIEESTIAIGVEFYDDETLKNKEDNMTILKITDIAVGDFDIQVL